MTNEKIPGQEVAWISPESQDSVETKLFSRIQGVVQGHDQLVEALARLRHSYELLQQVGMFQVFGKFCGK
jgi:hypothetical protein